MTGGQVLGWLLLCLAFVGLFWWAARRRWWWFEQIAAVVFLLGLLVGSAGWSLW